MKKKSTGFVGMPMIAPELREDRGEIEAALKGELPKLVQMREIRGDLHAHSALIAASGIAATSCL